MAAVVTDIVREFAETLLPSLGLDLYDVQFRREGHGWVLRLMIDSPAGISLEDCSRVSRELSDFLDVEDVIEHAYHLEVSSPGAERMLRSPEECRRFLGRRVRLKLRGELEGQNVVFGEMQDVVEAALKVVTDDGKEYTFPWDRIKKARLTL